MSEIKGIINRLKENEFQTLGRFYLYDGVKEIFSCVVLELADKNNEIEISRICGGAYKCVKRWSEKYKTHFHITDVEGRTLILIHWGNYYTNTNGCILFGEEFKYLNNDKLLDISASRDTIKEFMEIAPNEFELTINEV